MLFCFIYNIYRTTYLCEIIFHCTTHNEHSFFLISIFNELFKFKTSDEWEQWNTESTALDWKVSTFFLRSHRDPFAFFIALARLSDQKINYISSTTWTKQNKKYFFLRKLSRLGPICIYIYIYIYWSFKQCPTTVKIMALISLPPFICDLFPLINLWLVVKLLTRDAGIHSLISWRTGDIWDSVLSLLLKIVFQLRRQVEGVTSQWRQRRGGLINFKIMGSAKGAILQGARIVRKGRGRSCSLSWWRERVPLCEPDKGCGQLPWQFSDGYEPFEIWKYSLLESCVQRGQAVDRLAFATGWRDFDWDNLAQDYDYCLTLVDSILRRCQSVIDAGGMWTRY